MMQRHPVPAAGIARHRRQRIADLGKRLLQRVQLLRLRRVGVQGNDKGRIQAKLRPSAVEKISYRSIHIGYY